MNLLYKISKFVRWIKLGRSWGKYKATLGFDLDDAITRYGEVTGTSEIQDGFLEYEFDHRGIETSIIFEDEHAICIMHSSDVSFTEHFLREEEENARIGLSWEASSSSEEKILASFNYENLHSCEYKIRSDLQAWLYQYATKNLKNRRFYCNFMTGRWKRLDLRVYGKVIVNGKVVA